MISTKEQIIERLKAGKEVLVGYYNEDNWDCPNLIYAILKLVPKGGTIYDRYWKHAGPHSVPSDWACTMGDYDKDCEALNLNDLVHDRIFDAEAEALAWLRERSATIQTWDIKSA